MQNLLKSQNEPNEHKKLIYRDLNWTKLTILSLLWDKEMYGLEIKNSLEARQVPITFSRLYPTLRKLQSEGLLASQTEDRNNSADRIFYKTTKKGQQVFMNYSRDFIGLFFEGHLSKIGFVGDEVRKIIDLTKPGIIIADLSYDILESVLVKLIPSNDPVARYFIFCENEVKRNITKYRIQYHKLEQIVRLDYFRDKRTSLPENSVDVVFLLFTMHELGTDHYIAEAKRILKPSGSIVIADNLLDSSKSNFVLDLILQVFATRVEKKVYSNNLNKLLKENNLQIIHKQSVNSFEILLIKHE